jgi:hypothetical protein
MFKASSSKIRTSTLLVACLIWIVTFVVALGNVGAKWQDFQISLIFFCVGFAGLIIFLRREIDFIIYYTDDKVAAKIGMVLMIVSFCAIVFLILT